jgi:hypothetical protein
MVTMGVSEFWIVHNSVAQWLDPNRWSNYFTRVESILGAKLTHLDENDPVRRHVRSVADIGTYVCAFGSQETSRWLFGRMASIDVELSVHLNRKVTPSSFLNSLSWYVPTSFLQRDASCSRLRQLFGLGNETLRPFYSFGDELDRIKEKKKKQGSVDLGAELLGVFWLTYFNTAYVTFFGKTKFENLPGATVSKEGSATLVLADCPMLVPDELREQLAHTLGRQTFVDPDDVLGKLRGQHALTFDELLRLEKVDR